MVTYSKPCKRSKTFIEDLDTDTESTINQVASKRMVKKQPMRWSQEGAHLLLQVRARVLSDELRDKF